MFWYMFWNWCCLTKEAGTEYVTDSTGELIHAFDARVIIKKFERATKILANAQ